MELMQHIPDKSVDMILCDLPYGTTACEWDKVLPLDKLWKQYKRILKENGVVVLTASQPFTTDLINSNRDWFRYEWVWIKSKCTGFLTAKYRPMKQHENILIFCNKKEEYNPQGLKRGVFNTSRPNRREDNIYNGSDLQKEYETSEYGNYPKTALFIENPSIESSLHPTQKPVSLFRYLIKTYTNEGELVLDNCIGSGTTAVACKQANRRFIGIELNQEYVDVANERLKFSTLSDFYPKGEHNMHLNENHNSFCDFPKLVNQPLTTPSPTCLNANIPRLRPNFEIGSLVGRNL